MKRWLTAPAGLAAVGLVVLLAGGASAQGPGYPIPGQQESIPGIPGAGGQANPLGGVMLPTSPAPVRGGPRRTQIPDEWREQHEDPGLNRDILVTPAAGPYLIYVTSYTGPKGPSMARELVSELRGDPYRLPAFVFNYGEKERREELERVRKEVERRREALRQQGLSGDVPIRVPHMKIDVEVGVLVGGYRDHESARRDLERIKKLPTPDPRKVKLPGVVVGELSNRGTGTAKSAVMPVNPFVRAIVVRNPGLAGQKGLAADQRELETLHRKDLAILERLNSGAPYNLLKSRKPWTLAVKQFQLPTVIEQKTATGGFWGKLGLGGKSNERADTAAHNANALAELLRQGGWEAYVLHTRFNSVVTVGGYDRQDDPRIAHDQQGLAALNERLGRFDPGLRMFPQAIPMPVPR
jgi:hypothetical protein